MGAIVAYWPVRQGSGSALRRVVATAVPLALLIATIVLGTHLTFLAGARGVLFTAIALVWVCWRAGSDAAANVASRSAAARRRLIGVGTVVLGALIAGSLVGAVVQPATAKRVVARDEIVPPFDPLDYPSPLRCVPALCQRPDKDDAVHGRRAHARLVRAHRHDGQLGRRGLERVARRGHR